MSSQRPSPAIAARRTVALKRVDGEPLTRADIQYNVLHNIFHDTHNVFTNPYPSDGAPADKLCFRELYLRTILHSPKATKALKDKMTDSSAFAEDFAMLALLVNVGRVNTTMSFFPEMKTAIRTYHPIPALQRTTGNLQDAPRIKHILKSSVLAEEQGGTPSNPADILARVKAGQIPSTTVMNLIFVLANHSVPIGNTHFSEKIDFIDLFLRVDVSSVTRARAFLWLCYHYLEAPSTDSDDDYDDDGPPNPFADHRRGNTPTFVFLTESEAAQENVDPETEILLAEKLVAQRAEILKNQGTKESSKGLSKLSTTGSLLGEDEDEAIATTDEIRLKGKRDSVRSKASNASKEKKAMADKLRRSRLKEGIREREVHAVAHGPSNDEHEYSQAPIILPNQYPQHQDYYHAQPQLEYRSSPQFLYRRASSDTPEPPGHHPRFSPYRKGSLMDATQEKHGMHRQHRVQAPPIPPRSMLQQAWHVITTTDPLLDSDDEYADEHVRHDYIQRLRVITSLRQKETTPEPDRLSLP